MAKGYDRISHESIPGNETNAPTLSTKKIFPRLMSHGVKLNPKHLERDDELLNSDEAVAVLTEAYDPDWDLEARAYPDWLGYVLTDALGLPTTTAGDGIIVDPDAVVIPTGAHRHVWTAPGGPTGAKPKTFQSELAYSDSENAWYKLKGCATEQISIEMPESGGGMVKCSGPALYMTKTTDPALSPTYESDTIPPFLRSHLGIPTFLTGTGDFREFGVAIAIPLEVRHQAGSGSKFPDTVYKGDGPIIVTCSVPKELIDQDDWDALVAATGFAMKARLTSTAIIASGYPYKFFVEGSNAQYTDGGPDALTNRKRRGMENLVVKLTRAGTASWTFTLVNSSASYV